MNSARLTHITLNTRHVASTPRTAIPQDVIECLLPLVQAGSGPVPGSGNFHLFCWQPEGKSRAFQIARQPGLSKLPLVVCHLCWSAEDADEGWGVAKQGYDMLRKKVGSLLPGGFPPCPAKPAETPWLAVTLCPALFTSFDPECAYLLGGLERGLAWTMLALEQATGMPTRVR